MNCKGPEVSINMNMFGEPWKRSEMLTGKILQVAVE